MWKRVQLYGNIFYLLVRSGVVTQVISGDDCISAKDFEDWYPDLFRTLKRLASKHVEIVSRSFLVGVCHGDT